MMSLSLNAQIDQAPSITAQGRQAYCPDSTIRIVSDFTITDPDDTSIAAFFIQISKGYQINFDVLELTGNYPFITSFWNATEGKLTLSSAITGTEIPLETLESAVKDVVFKTTAGTIVSEKIFSLSIGDANYLPLTDHFYEFVDEPNITWKDAKTAAESRNYFGRQGYLATLTNQEEADFAGKQAAGTGWIGGSDEENEGEWKWVTGPEAGTVFWNGTINGTSPNFAFWNINEPNDFRGNNPVGEDYAHITDPSIGIRGAWNDLPNEGGIDLYVPRGYIVEYGTPDDAPLNIVATTSIYVPQIIATNNITVCESENAIINAVASEGEVLWYKTPNINAESPEFTGNNLTVNNVTQTTTYYAAVSVNGCTTLPRTPVTINVIKKPEITNTTGDLICEGVATINAQASSGEIYWYETETSNTPVFIGNSFSTPFLTKNKSYFVEAYNSNCGASSRVEVTVIIDTITPEFDVLQDTIIICTDIGTINLETTNAKGNYSYVWQKNNEILGSDAANIRVDSPGTYSVIAVSEAGCASLPKNIQVVASEAATITANDVLIIDNPENKSILVSNTNLGIGNYEFAIDDEFGSYQKEGFFDHLSTGVHILYIKDLNGCKTQRFVFSILGYPKFFTPNKDGTNDVWNITGFDKTFYSSSEILIFNRFGKFLYKIDENSEGWNGSYNGKNLPSNTYWFKATLIDNNGLSVEKTGNFSLIRK